MPPSLDTSTLAVSSSIVTCYHGTSVERAAGIIREQRFIPSRNAEDWLGDGVYFFQDGLGHAQRWAQKRFGEHATVIEAEVRLGRCLDLLSGLYDGIMQAGYAGLEAQHTAAGTQPPVNTVRGRNERDCAIMRLIVAAATDPIQTIRCSFPEGDPLYPGAAIGQLDHTQLCVLDQACIQTLTWLR